MEFKDALIKARFYCAQQERSKFEVKKKLFDWKVNEQFFDQIITQLEGDNFLSEKRFADLFVKSKINQKKWGRLKIRNELMKYHIETGILEGAISRANQDDIEKNMKSIAEKKRIELEGKEDKNHDKLKRFLYSKGYEPELIIEYLNANNI
ncbi:MAG: recombination regulator RecX [Bacteroidales bacterium]|nr:recombination regulator RecX [Bacteroidales bacterium]